MFFLYCKYDSAMMNLIHQSSRREIVCFKCCNIQYLDLASRKQVSSLQLAMNKKKVQQVVELTGRYKTFRIQSLNMVDDVRAMQTVLNTGYFMQFVYIGLAFKTLSS